MMQTVGLLDPFGMSTYSQPSNANILPFEKSATPPARPVSTTILAFKAQ